MVDSPTAFGAEKATRLWRSHRGKALAGAIYTDAVTGLDAETRRVFDKTLLGLARATPQILFPDLPTIKMWQRAEKLPPRKGRGK
jgi:hypothetical protein